MSTPTSLTNILGKLEAVRKVGDNYTAKCPAHADTNPSLSIKAGVKGITLFCFAGHNTPGELRTLSNWVSWRMDSPREPGGKPVKVPINPHTGKMGSSTDPKTWGTFEQASERSSRDGLAGVGFCFDGSGYTGIDLDHCVTDGVIEPWAMEIITSLNSYSEVSQSGEGIHIIVRGSLPAGARKKGDIEAYDSGRYFATTGNHVEGTPHAIESRQAELEAFHAHYLGDAGHRETAPSSAETLSMSDEQVLDRMLNSKSGSDIWALMGGDISGYPSHSEADAALCSHLGFWTGGNAAQMERIFRTSGLMRDKWDSKRGSSTYGAQTIQQAIQSTNTFYAPPTVDKNTSRIIRPLSTDSDSERDKSVTKSVTYSKESVSSVTKDAVFEWVKDSNGWFSYEELDRELGIRTPEQKANRRKIMQRLRDSGVIEAHTRDNKLFRYKLVETRLIDFKAAGKRSPLAIRLPLGIERYFNAYPGNIIGLAGDADAGKTGFLLNTVRMNMENFPIYYQSSEMASQELASRLLNFEGIDLADWNFVAEERSSNFADVIRPSAINIIDYLELGKDFYAVADHMRQIHDRLEGGICIIALQKKRGAELGRGGDFGLEKPRLYLSMNRGQITIQKCKNWVNHEENPNGLKLDFKIVGGCKFIITRDWYREII